ncbi:MAG TPA: hypothetical protein VLH19_03835 [Patescibacteria group bacterium]|nr:hypothetical protein [Patescibacteria group bacterium]
MLRYIQSHKELLGVVTLCIVAFFLHSYALPRDLIFAYDQGRDAFAVQKILSGDVVLLGPVTGLDGVFLGPFFTYLLVPFYWLGKGNPIVAAYFIVLLRVLCVPLLYYLGKKAGGPARNASHSDVGGWKIGAIASVLFAFSFKNVLFSRWLSNPTPLTFFSLLLMFSLLKAVKESSYLWYAISGLILGLCMQLESSNAITYLLLIPIFLFTVPQFRKKFVQTSVILVASFSVTLIPQLLFELRHGFLMTHALLRSFATNERVSLIHVLPGRLLLLLSNFSDSVFYRMPPFIIPILIAVTIALWMKRKVWWKNIALRLIVLWLLVPFIFHLFYTGNHGNFWEYYMIAQFIPFYLVLGWGASFPISSAFWRSLRGAIVLVVLFVAIISSMRIWTDWLHPYNDRFAWSMQTAAAQFMVTDSGSKPYGVWVYTPSYQDEADRYAIEYVGSVTGIYPQEHAEQQSIIYLFVEDDPVYWTRRRDWISEKESFGKVTEEKKFGAITVIRLDR